MVLAGVGMKHDTLVEYANKYFQSSKPVWEKDPSLIDSKRGIDCSLSQYTGGVVHIEKDLSNVSLGPNPMPELAHCVIGLEGCSHEDQDFVNFCVLNMIMGGGGSFSAGGPGKGMYTRLYINVLNRHHWMHNAMAHHHAYRDSGIFCIHASAHPSMMKDVVEVIARELVIIKDGIGKTELDRAKTQLQSVLLMNLESRPVVFEDIGRQVLASGKRLSSQYFYDKIGQVTEDDIIRISKRMLSSKVSVACFGDTSYMPSIDDIQAALISKDGKIPRRFSLCK
jgi:processing peptidase subunit alpha